MSKHHTSAKTARIGLLLAGLLLAGVAAADKAGDVAALEATCESQREAKIKPLRDQEIAKCKADGRSDAAYCERYFKDYGNSMRTVKGGVVPRMFDDLPSCKLAFAAKKALADGDPIPSSED